MSDDREPIGRKGKQPQPARNKAGRGRRKEEEYDDYDDQDDEDRDEEEVTPMPR